MIYSSLLSNFVYAETGEENKEGVQGDEVFCPKLHCFPMELEQSFLNNQKDSGESNECFRFPNSNDG